MTKWSVTHKSIIFFLTVLLIIFGIYCFVTLEREENPAITSPVCVIKTIYPGASPEDVEKQVIKPVEDEVKSLSEIKKIESYAMDSVGLIKVSLKDMSDNQINDTWDKVKDKLELVKPSLPSTAYEPEIETDFSSAYGLIIGLSSDAYSYEDINNAADILSDMLSSVEGVKAVEIDGKINQQIEIIMDMTKLERYKISPTTIATVLKARNVNIPGGNLELEDSKIPVQVTGEYQSFDEIGRTIVSISKENGTPVYLKDVASIEKTNEKIEKAAFVNGEKAVLVGAKYMEGINILNVEKELQHKISEFEKNELYADMNMLEVYNQADFVEDSIDLFTNNLISAVLLVLIVVLVAMGLRSAVVVSLPIPLVIFIVFGYMKLAEIPLHQISIGSLIISLSLLVANGIVSNDNMHVYLDKGHDIMTACTTGINEVKIPILTSTLTTIASFLPLAMMQGSAGKFVRSLPILVSVALIASYITSLTIVPTTGYVLFNQDKLKKDGRIKKLFDGILEKVHFNEAVKKMATFYETSLSLCLKKPRLTILSFLGLFIVTILVIPTIDVQLFPPVEREQYVLNVTAKDGTTLEKTDTLCRQVSEILKMEESIDNFSYKIGDGYMKYYVTFFPNDLATNKAQFLINGKRSEAINVEKKIIEAVAGIDTNIKYLDVNLPIDFPVQARVSGGDISVLRKVSEEVKAVAETVEGIKSVEINYGSDSYKLMINVNEEKASMAGLSNYDIASTIRMAVNGIEITDLKQEDINKDSLPIIMKVSDNEKNSEDVLNRIFLTSQITGSNIPLSQIAQIDTDMSYSKIIRRNGQRTITVGAFVKEGYNTQNVMNDFKKALEDYTLPKGYTMEYGGESENSHDAFSSMGVPSIIAVILIYLILVLQFGDLTEPLIIMGTIPLSFIGVFWGLKLMNYPIGFMALLGAISLMGVVVNNGIVLLDYIKLMMGEKDDLIIAISVACKTRLRPIIIGMVTTVISLLPLMATGGDLWAPLATSIVFGMILSSVLTLILIPCAFLLMQRRKKGSTMS